MEALLMGRQVEGVKLAKRYLSAEQRRQRADRRQQRRAQEQQR